MEHSDRRAAGILSPVVRAGAAIALLALAAYARSFHGPFLLDDDGTIGSNPSIRHWFSALSPPPGGLPVSGRPVANLSFALNYALGGTRVEGYHAVNLTIHILAAWTLFGVVRRTLVRVAPALGPTALAFAIAVLWAVHPLQTQAVTYLSQRVESLMGLFYLLTLYGFIRAADAEKDAGCGCSGNLAGRSESSSDLSRPGAATEGTPSLTEGMAGRPRRSKAKVSKWLALSVGACLVGMATKEVMITAPLMVFLYDRTLVAGTAAAAWRARRRYYWTLAATGLVLAFLVWGAGGRAGTAGFATGVPWWAYALTQIGAVAHYLRLAIWPHPLVGDYGRFLGGRPQDLAVDLAVEAMLVAATLWALFGSESSRRGRRAWGLAGAWTFLILAPSSSVVPVATEIVAEHRMYLPLAGVISAIVVGLVALGRTLAGRMGWSARSRAIVGAAALGATICALAGATLVHNETYRSPFAFWTEVARWRPDNAGAHNNLGNILLERADLDGAAAQYAEALRLVPTYADAHLNLGHVRVRQGRLAEAVDHYRAALRFQADSVEAHVACGDALAQLGRSAEAIDEYETALALQPNQADVHNNLGGLLAEAGHLAEARAHFEAAVSLRPDFAPARDNLDRVKQMMAAP